MIIIRFLNDPLDETYLVPPESSVPDGMLPPQEFEVGFAAMEMKFFVEQWLSIGFWSRLFKPKEWVAARDVAIQKQRQLMTVVNISPEHKAALRRIVNNMPHGNGGREALASYLK